MSGSSCILSLYLIYSVVTLVAFYFYPARSVALTAFFAGWLTLPVAIFPNYTITADNFTQEIIGAALPSNLGITKALLIPMIIIVGLTFRQPAIWFRWRPDMFDSAILALCAWPLTLLASDLVTPTQAFKQAGYLAAVWGGTWMIGRLALSDREGRSVLLYAIAWSGIALLPFSILEGILRPFAYKMLYGGHPFLLDGAVRYIGYRPLGLFEHGNQFGIWLAMSALAWLQLARHSTEQHALPKCAGVAVLAGVIASQSFGAIFLMLAGGLAILLPRKCMQRLFITAMAGLLVFGTLYVSGAIPVKQLEQKIVAGQTLHEVLQKTVRGSLRWRIRNDLESLRLIHEAPIAGYGTWDWWRPLNAHPWGLPLLLAGQFGWIALFLAIFATVGRAALAIIRKMNRALPIIVCAAAVDAALNSFIYFPALLVAGSLTQSPQSDRVRG